MSKVVIIVEGGVIQNIIADDDTVKVLVLDCDVEGLEGNTIKNFKTLNGDTFEARIAYDEIDGKQPEIVNYYFDQI